MTFVERMREVLDQGVAASKDIAQKAGAKAQDLGERGVMMLEVKQLESLAQKHIGRLGAEVYNAFVERGEETLSAENVALKSILSEIASVRASIEEKETELQARKTK